MAQADDEDVPLPQPAPQAVAPVPPAAVIAGVPQAGERASRSAALETVARAKVAESPLNAYMTKMLQRTPEQRKALYAERAADGVLAMAEYRAAEAHTRKLTAFLRAERLARKSVEIPVVAKPAAPARRRKAKK